MIKQKDILDYILILFADYQRYEMYSHTIEGLFAAVARGALAEVEEVVKSGKVDVNQLHNNKHIINYALGENFSPDEVKILCLINAGAIPQFDEEVNILLKISFFKNKELQSKLLTLIKEANSLKGKYTLAHFKAIDGLAPNSEEEAFKLDHFGFFPIHYAIKFGAANASWFKNIQYDFFTPIKSGLYEGINLFRWLIPKNNTNLDLMHLIERLSPEQYYELLKSALFNPKLLCYGMTVAWVLLDHKRYEDFTRLTQNLSVVQCFEILKSALLNPNHARYGLTVAEQLLYEKRYEDFTRLTQDLSAEQCYELLKSALFNPKHLCYGMTVAWLLIKHKRFTDFEMLVKELSLNQLTELFSEVHSIASESPQKAEIKLTLLNYLAKENEPLLIKILELYETNDLVEKLYDKLEKNNESFDVVCYVILQKCNIALREFMQSKSDQKEETKEIIKDYLKSLLDIYEQIAANSKYSKIANELVGMTISNASKTGYKQLFQDYFERLDAPDCRYMSDYKSIKSREPLNTLEGYGHYLRVLGCQNAEQAILLGIEHGEAKSGKGKLQKNDELLKPPVLVTEPPKPPVTKEESNSEELEFLRRQIQALKEENEKLKEKHSHTEQPVSNSEDEKNKELRTTRGDPRLFSTGVTPSNSISRPKRALEGVGLGQIPSRKRMG